MVAIDYRDDCRFAIVQIQKNDCGCFLAASERNGATNESSMAKRNTTNISQRATRLPNTFRKECE
jgi:hypothetical protein